MISNSTHLLNLKHCYLKGKRNVREEGEREKKQPEFINQWHALLTHLLQESPNTCFSSSCAPLKSLTFMLFTEFRRFFFCTFCSLKSKLKLRNLYDFDTTNWIFFMVDLWFLAATDDAIIINCNYHCTWRIFVLWQQIIINLIWLCTQQWEYTMMIIWTHPLEFFFCLAGDSILRHVLGILIN